MPRFQDDPKEVRAQYSDPANLSARMRIYTLYSSQTQLFPRWVFDRLVFPPKARVLEVGTGSGTLWVENLERVPGDAQITLSDLNPPMLDKARADLDGRLVAEFREFDVQSIPFPHASFDVAIANHMLYHVPDRAAALRELHRVLAPGGTLYVVTNGWAHLAELRELVHRLFPDHPLRAAHREPDYFDLETGARELEAVFSNVRLESERNVLRITDAEPVVDYVSSVKKLLPNEAEQLRDHLRWWIGLEGFFHVSTWAGLLTATSREAPARAGR